MTLVVLLFGKPTVRAEMANIGRHHLGCGRFTLEIELFDEVMWNGRKYTGGPIRTIWVWSVVDR